MLFFNFTDLKVDVHRKDSSGGVEDAIGGATGGLEEGAVASGAVELVDGASAAGSPHHGSIEVVMVDEVNSVMTPNRTPGMHSTRMAISHRCMVSHGFKSFHL